MAQVDGSGIDATDPLDMEGKGDPNASVGLGPPFGIAGVWSLPRGASPTTIEYVNGVDMSAGELSLALEYGTSSV